jgi:uncharacterized protein YijF (DUF1287 family)
MIARRTFLYAISTFLAANTSTSLHAAPDATESWAQRLLAAAEAQVGVTTLYSPAYVRIPYADGDVPRDRGVCTDVRRTSIEALRFTTAASKENPAALTAGSLSGSPSHLVRENRQQQ